ncbi:ral guanine nucleotide dissociation stimulator-like isoform X1 [Sinocyclocheilus anshuiensis]|uniref:ral guanine nucleotide dissociation stimulator-like isoform X1 n=1 Tax=Sinocyclocheilus anshuiensis TaxID=1608454 RepID=UPI0007BADAF2|nr:PREDICTED: ral guanine nucleotide dissociation stimulator-like isoform X1 [Sinocyclocheilus anshuiensis]XP_016313836.1 PREDICTED: ral guanine nucleotide dissociation stimulator-like isoform X1 [Sinocyclocheilus anshuiensis]
MLPRSMKTSGVELPGVGPREVPLIGYRPLQPEVDGHKDQLWKENENREADHTQGEPSPMKTTWYCPLDLSTVSKMEEDGIIYTVVVKQGHVSPAGPQSTASRSQHVKAGTEEKLVLHLLHSFSMGDSSFISIFLSTYRSFTSTQRVLDILIDRLGNPLGESNSNTRQMFNKAVCTVFSTWLSDYPEDFRSLNDPSCLLRLAPLLPTDTSGAEIKGRLLRIAEELSEKTLLSGSLSDPTKGVTSPDPSEFDATSILGFPSSVIAEQLTRIETDLFLKLVPYHCLGSLWSQRDKKGREGACWSVRATIKQFNRLANAVTASCLWNTALKSQQRARLLEKWISVAEACRSRKNFSSLYAILSALQSNPIHRLRKTWQETDREAVRRYEELSDIFSEKDNYSQSRELLKEEGTSKLSNLDTKINNRRFTGSCAQGTVPYLGIFLRDLTMLDTAVKDRLENGFINFDKRRREFEVIAQIRLLQSSCRNSIFRTDETFVQWYHSVPTLREEESYKLSNQIEAPGEPSPGRGLNPTVIITQCPDALSAMANTTMDADGIFDFPSPVNHLLSRLYKHVKSPSVSCLDVDSSPPPNDATPSVLTTPTTAVKSHRRSVSCGNNPTNNKPEAGPDMRIVRIRMDLHDGNLYRSILVTSNDKTPTVISSALEKHNQNAQEVSKYELIQLLPEGKELIIPPTGNVFYAMSSASVDFLLRRRGGNTPTGSLTLGNETSATFPRIKAKGRRLVRTLF